MDQHKNFAYSTVATAPSPAISGTSLVVATGDGAKFPTPPFNMTIWPAGANPLTTNAEIVRVTAIATDTLTIVRAQEGSSARTVVVGDQVANVISAKTLTDIEQLPSTTQTDTNYTAVIGDAETLVNMNSVLPRTFTIPLNSSVAFPIGAQIVIGQGGAGVISIVGAGGVTLIGPSMQSNGQGTVLCALKTATDTWWIISGNNQPIATSWLTPTVNQTIASNYGAVIPRKYTIASGTKLILNLGAIFKIV